MAAQKTPCPVGRGEFLGKARPIVLTGRFQADSDELFTLTLYPREFAPNGEGKASFGWAMNGPVAVPLLGKLPQVQVSANFVLANSRDVPAERPHVAQAG
jgi:hypothetical protein